MAQPRTETAEERRRRMDTGCPPCGEAQADGVPCDELGRDCEDCEKAEPPPEGSKSARRV